MKDFKSYAGGENSAGNGGNGSNAGGNASAGGQGAANVEQTVNMATMIAKARGRFCRRYSPRQSRESATAR